MMQRRGVQALPQPARRLNLTAVMVFVSLMLGACLHAAEFAEQRRQVLALGDLTTAPTMTAAAGFAVKDGVRPVFFEGLPWQGRPTKVFAWLGIPEGKAGKLPGVVLVHGGGGTAFRDWVKRWNDRGFAAISIAVEGQTDKKEANAAYGSIATKWNKHEFSGPQRVGIYHDSDQPLPDQWMYHAVADTILANSLLRAQPGVNADQVGLMGISWGGVITSTVVGIDSRFAFAIPTYGCGSLADAANQYGRCLATIRSISRSGIRSCGCRGQRCPCSGFRGLRTNISRLMPWQTATRQPRGHTS